MKNKEEKIDFLILASQLAEMNFLSIKKTTFGKSYLFIALDPETQVFLKKKNEKFILPSKFFDSKTDISILLESQKILKKYEKGINLIKIEGIKDCFLNYINFYLVFKIREWLIIDNVLKKINTKKIIYEGSNNFIYSILLEWCGNKKIGFISFRKAIQKSFLKKNKIRIFNFFNIIIFEILLVIYKVFFKKNNKNQMFISGPEYNLLKIVNKTKEYTKDFLPVYLLSSSSFFYKNKLCFFKGNFFSFRRVFALITFKYKREFNTFNDNIDNAIINFKKIKYEEKDSKPLYDELNNFMSFFLKKNCVELFRSYIGLKKIFENNTNRILSVTQDALGFQGLLGEMSNSKSFTSLLVTHGSHTKQKDSYAKLSWDERNKTLINAKFTFSAMQTPLAYDYFINEKEKKAKLLITGPLIFGLKTKMIPKEVLTREMIFKENSKKFIFLHAGTPKDPNYFRPIIYETLDEYVKNLVDIINAIKECKGTFLAIKFRETDLLKLDMLKQLLPKDDCYEIYIDGKFSDYLTYSDFLISYSSTTIEEALINQKPVLLYNPRNNYFHIKGELLEEENTNLITTVYNINSRKNLSWGLNWIKKNFSNKKNFLQWEKYSFKENELHSYKKIINKVFKI